MCFSNSLYASNMTKTIRMLFIVNFKIGYKALTRWHMHILSHQRLDSTLSGRLNILQQKWYLGPLSTLLRKGLANFSSWSPHHTMRMYKTDHWTRSYHTMGEKKGERERETDRKTQCGKIKDFRHASEHKMFKLPPSIVAKLITLYFNLTEWGCFDIWLNIISQSVCEVLLNESTIFFLGGSKCWYSKKNFIEE